MGGCRCSYKTCNSTTKTSENLHFFHYPVKHRDRCATWIRHANKLEFMNLPDDQLKNKVICGLHFENKYFTNEQKKRLVHDAVPTLDNGCDFDTTYVKDVQILPTSIDGTTFTLQAHHLQPGTSTNEKFSFKDGKMILQNFTPDSEVYTINPSYIQQPFYTNKDNFMETNESLIIYKSENSNSQDDHTNNMLFSENSDTIIQNQNFKEEFITAEIKQNSQQPLIMELDNLLTENSEEQKKDSDTEDKEKRRTPKRQMNKTVLKTINYHAQEIANIKRSLAQNNKLSKKKILKSLRGKVPETLLGALSMHLFKKSSDLSHEEKSFLHALYAISPSAYKTLEDYGWFIPKHDVIEGSINIKE